MAELRYNPLSYDVVKYMRYANGKTEKTRVKHNITWRNAYDCIERIFERMEATGTYKVAYMNYINGSAHLEDEIKKITYKIEQVTYG